MEKMKIERNTYESDLLCRSCKMQYCICEVDSSTMQRNVLNDSSVTITNPRAGVPEWSKVKPIGKKQRKSSNKKRVKRKKAKNGV